MCFLEVIDHLLLTFGKLDVGHSGKRNMGLNLGLIMGLDMGLNIGLIKRSQHLLMTV